MNEPLAHYVTDLDGDVFALKELPEVVKGALFSKYSRSQLGLRPLLEREFLHAERGEGDPLQRAQEFYDRILDGYGDDSIGELGGAHLAIENVSMLGAKVLEDRRIGGSPLEKSTRYVPFDQLRNGRFAYYRDPTIMASPLAEAYEGTCDALFRTYRELFSPLMRHLERQAPRDESKSERAQQTALRARAYDNLRGLLPVATLTNVGLFGNGRYFEGLLQHLRLHPLAEMQALGQSGFDQLSKLIPSFIRRARGDHPHLAAFAEYHSELAGVLSAYAKESSSSPVNTSEDGNSAHLIDSDSNAMAKVAAALIYPYSNHSLAELDAKARCWDHERLTEFFQRAAQGRRNRRHKSPRALERAQFTFDLMADFGIYRDLQRHRLLTQERQLLNSNLGYEVPSDLLAANLAEPYCRAMNSAGQLATKLAEISPEVAQYAVPMGYRLRWYFHINLRSLQWLCELRSSPAGHPAYRRIAQQLCAEVQREFPPFAAFFQFVDFGEALDGRLEQERRNRQRSECALPSANP